MNRTPANLQALCDALNEFEPSHDNERLEDTCDLCNLPTFGGAAPADTAGIWSWDADSVLVYCDHDSTFRVTPRATLA
jgi:hypothetical protein